MKFTNPLLKYVLTTASAVLLSYSSFAGGFPVRQGRLILSPSVSYFFANKEWDSVGVKKSFPNNGKFQSIEFSLAAEYGISRRWAAVALVPYVINTFQQTGFKSTTTGFTDAETGLKYYLANINYQYYFSLQGTAITPMYTNKNLGYGAEGAEFKVAFAGSGEMGSKNFYFNVEDGIRRYFDASGPLQDRYTATFGLTLDRNFKNQLSVAFGGFYTYSSYKYFNLTNPSATKNFTFNQVSLSYGHSFNHDISIFLTAGQFITGRNTGDGTSGQIGLAYRIGN